ncbi:MAG: glycolate oxidase subunit GlcE [Gammaproteobacteria bacterium]|nr:glycolate oxidase subunit GlcE [Gammaproteobacteria bacterium]
MSAEPPDRDRTDALREAVARACAEQTPLRVRGGDSKAFYGRRTAGQTLDLADHRGIVAYEPSELVLTARAGTPLSEVEAALAAERQALPFEPPHFGPGATLGGTVACGLSGPRRPYAGATRDFVLGVQIVNGRGEVLRFGGQVMKNVAGYDVSRLMVGALGTLGVLLEVSVKVLPAPAREVTVALEANATAAIETMNRLAGRPLPLSAASHAAGRLYLRLSGSERGVEAARASLGGETTDGGFWEALREHRLPFFAGEGPLWRLSVPPTAPPLDLPGPTLLDWGGAQRWLRTEATAARVCAVAGSAGGHATLFRGGDRDGEVFHPLAPSIATLHRRLKAAFDPAGVLNPGRFYAEL